MERRKLVYKYHSESCAFHFFPVALLRATRRSDLAIIIVIYELEIIPAVIKSRRCAKIPAWEAEKLGLILNIVQPGVANFTSGKWCNFHFQRILVSGKLRLIAPAVTLP